MFASIHHFFTESFMPHGHCFFWTPSILWSSVLSDGLIAMAYFSIPIALIYFVRRRKDVPFNWVFILFSVFILLCGLTHVMGIVTMWEPLYGLEVTIKALTAIASVLTAYLVWPLIPQALKIPSSKHLQEANLILEKKQVSLKDKTQKLKESNQELEQFNRLAVGRELKLIELKKEINQLCEKLNEAPRYDITLLESGTEG